MEPCFKVINERSRLFLPDRSAPVRWIASNGSFYFVQLGNSFQGFFGDTSTEEVKDVYYPSKFTNKDYPEIVSAEGSVETISVGNVLAVYNWPETHDRYRKVSKFVNAFLSRLEELRTKPGFHPKWKQVNPYSKVRGWQRFKAAQDWINADLARRKKQESSQTGSIDNNADFKKFLAEQKIVIGNSTDSNKLAQIVQEYLKWRDARQ